LEVAQHRQAVRAPVHQPRCPVDQSLFIQPHKNFAHDSGKFWRQGELFPRPVAAFPDLPHLPQNHSAAFFFPLPDAPFKLFPPELPIVDPLLRQLPHHHALRRDSCMIHSRQVQGVVSPHAMPPRQDIDFSVIEHMPDHTEIDILTRWHRMRGYNTLYLPGMDHAGISTQRVVVRQLAEQGIDYRKLGREEFERRVWKWKEESGGMILGQMRQIGESCDWSREKFTLSPELSRVVREVFVRLYEEGLIYRATQLVNWCPDCLTVLSDLEVAHEERQGHLWHIKYPIVGTKDFLTVATTRPETMLGDTAVAVHPEDERYKHLVGGKALLPLMNREIPIIADEMVDREFGTGAVKITPAHDPNDFETGKRHKLAEIDVMTDDGKMSAAAGSYAGMDRFAARKRVVEELQKQGALEKITDHVNAIGLCERSKTVVEPRISTQWFCKMK